MSLPSNLKQQLARRLKQNIEKAYPEMSASFIDDVTLSISEGGATKAVATFKTRSYSGFNIVAELSSSAGEGQPETELWLETKDDNGAARNAKLVKLAAQIGCSSLKILESSAPAAANAVDANVLAEIPNDPTMGAVGV